MLCPCKEPETFTFSIRKDLNVNAMIFHDDSRKWEVPTLGLACERRTTLTWALTSPVALPSDLVLLNFPAAAEARSSC